MKYSNVEHKSDNPEDLMNFDQPWRFNERWSTLKI